MSVCTPALKTQNTRQWERDEIRVSELAFTT